MPFTLAPELFLRELPSWKGLRVTVAGLGAFGGGCGVARFLRARGCRVTVTDLKTADALSSSLARLDGLDVRLQLGGHRLEDFTKTELVVVNPAVPDDSPYLQEAVRAGVPLETELNLFLKLCRGRVLGITGSNGKTTTTALTAEMLRGAGMDHLVGGNIGRSLLEEVDAIRETTWVVLELSSFQLERAAVLRRSPDVAVVTNVSPNHLDRHGSMEAYLEAKRNVLRFQARGDRAVLNADDEQVLRWGELTSGEQFHFSIEREVSNGAWVKDGVTFFRRSGRREEVMPAGNVRLRGRFNLANILAAACAARLAGAPCAAIRSAAEAFRGVPHRMETVTHRGDVEYINDSIATTPTAAAAAVEAIAGKLVLIAGGYDKGLPFEPLVRAVSGNVRAAVLIGATAPAIREALQQLEAPPEIHLARDLREAVQLASRLARPGETVLLSPACASYDQFANFVERGDRFRRLVQNLSPS